MGNGIVGGSHVSSFANLPVKSQGLETMAANSGENSGKYGEKNDHQTYHQSDQYLETRMHPELES